MDWRIIETAKLNFAWSPPIHCFYLHYPIFLLIIHPSFHSLPSTMSMELYIHHFPWFIHHFWWVKPIGFMFHPASRWLSSTRNDIPTSVVGQRAEVSAACLIAMDMKTILYTGTFSLIYTFINIYGYMYIYIYVYIYIYLHILYIIYIYV